MALGFSIVRRGHLLGLLAPALFWNFDRIYRIDRISFEFGILLLLCMLSKGRSFVALFEAWTTGLLASSIEKESGAGAPQSKKIRSLHGFAMGGGAVVKQMALELSLVHRGRALCF